MSLVRHITWENFRDNFVQPGDPAAHRLDGEPRCDVFVDSAQRRIGLRVAVRESSQAVDIPYQHIRTKLVQYDGRLCVEVSCDVQSLYEPFYAMLVSTADLVQRHGYSPTAALEESAKRFFSLLSAHAMLSEEKQIGLWCELWVLEQLVRFRGPKFVQAWIGPRRDPHDFRFDVVELEVKGTRSPKRSHLISSEEQLLPSDNRDLYLLSMQLAVAKGDDACTLPERVGNIEDMVANAPRDLSLFKALLSEANYSESHQQFYLDAYKLRTRPTLIPITDNFPRITKDILRAALGADKSRRLSDVQFRLDVSDLGFEEASEQFQTTVRTI